MSKTKTTYSFAFTVAPVRFVFLSALLKTIISLINIIAVISLTTTLSLAEDRGLLSMEVKRASPERELLLELIDDEIARRVFASLNLASAEDQGALDSAIASRWCGLTPDMLQSLFDSRFVRESELGDFVNMPEPITEKFDVYGVRSVGYRQFGIGVNNNDECLMLYIVDTN